MIGTLFTQKQVLRLFKMPPKQATLGYVKDSQTTLGWVRLPKRKRLLLIHVLSKFFGKPNGTNAPAKQSKLSFSTKPSSATPSSSAAKENEDAEMKDEDSDTEVKPIPKKETKKEEAVDSKENVKPAIGIKALL